MFPFHFIDPRLIPFQQNHRQNLQTVKITWLFLDLFTSQNYLTKQEYIFKPFKKHHGITKGGKYPPTKLGKGSKSPCMHSKKPIPRTKPTISTSSRTGRGNSLRSRRRCWGCPPAPRRSPSSWRGNRPPNSSHRIRDRRRRTPFPPHQLPTNTSRRRLLLKTSPQHTWYHRFQKQRSTWFGTQLIPCQSIPQSPIFIFIFLIIIIRE